VKAAPWPPPPAFDTPTAEAIRGGYTQTTPRRPSGLVTAPLPAPHQGPITRVLLSKIESGAVAARWRGHDVMAADPQMMRAAAPGQINEKPALSRVRGLDPGVPVPRRGMLDSLRDAATERSLTRAAPAEGTDVDQDAVAS